jgi:Rieske Fe-S protein
MALTLSAIAGAIVGISFFRQFSYKRTGAGKQVRLGALSDFPVDTYTFIEEHNIFVYRDHESVKAVSAVCTHLGCTVQRTTGGFECPCHGSSYADDGSVVSGPAPTDLAWYKMHRTNDGKLMVDLDAVTGPDDKLIFI